MSEHEPDGVTLKHDPSRVAMAFPPSEMKYLRKEMRRERLLERVGLVKHKTGRALYNAGGVIRRGVLPPVLLPFALLGFGMLLVSIAVGALWGWPYGLLSFGAAATTLSLVMLSD